MLIFNTNQIVMILKANWFAMMDGWMTMQMWFHGQKITAVCSGSW